MGTRTNEVQSAAVFVIRVNVKLENIIGINPIK